MDLLIVACQFHKSRFSDPCVVCTFSLCVAEVGEPLPRVSLGGGLELKCILVLAKSEPEGCTYVRRI